MSSEGPYSRYGAGGGGPGYGGGGGGYGEIVTLWLNVNVY
jgi:hypothetical protein